MRSSDCPVDLLISLLVISRMRRISRAWMSIVGGLSLRFAHGRLVNQKCRAIGQARTRLPFFARHQQKRPIDAGLSDAERPAHRS